MNFRLTDTEYQKIQTALVSQGVRCLSDFAREAVLRHADRDSNADAGSEVPYLSQRVLALESTVRRVELSLAELMVKLGSEV